MTSPSIETQLAVISTKLDLLIEQRSDHENRLRSLERFRWLFVGAALAGGSVAGAVVSALLN